MFKLPNGNQIDTEMVETAMDDSSLENSYYLNTETGEVLCFADFESVADEVEETLEEIEKGDLYIPIERLSSNEAYEWMENFVDEIVAPKNQQVAEKLAIALRGKGSFRRFKDALQRIDDKWVQAWHQYRNDQFNEAMKEWFGSLSIQITEEISSDNSSEY